MEKKAKKLGDHYLTSMAEEAIRASDPNFFRSINKKCTALDRMEDGNPVHFGNRILNIVEVGLIDDVTDYHVKEPTAEEILVHARRTLSHRIKEKKQNIISFMNTIIKDLGISKANLEAGIDDPVSSCWTNMYGEVQNVSRLESFVGQLHGLVEAYKELKGRT